jgi:hypothetical protein
VRACRSVRKRVPARENAIQRENDRHREMGAAL